MRDYRYLTCAHCGHDGGWHHVSCPHAEQRAASGWRIAVVIVVAACIGIALAVWIFGVRL